MNACPNCSVGRLAEARVSYLAELDGYQVMIPYVPAVVCDVCGRIEYDLDYLRNWSISLDLWIMVRTVILVWKDRNAY